MKRLVLLLFFVAAGTVLLAQDEPAVEVDTAVVEELTYEYDTAGGPFGIAETYQDDDDSSEENTPTVDPKDTEAAAAYMNEEVSRKKFDEKDLKAIIGDVNFDENPQKEEEAPKERAPSKPWFTLPSISPAILQLISFLVIFVLIAVILYFIARNITFNQNIKKMKIAGDVTAPVENIEEVDIDAMLKKALAEGDLRAAVRVHYLMLLKKLNEVGLIIWKKDKTNRDYLSELYGRNDCYEDVRKLTVAYELVWYGERSVSRDSFDRIAGEFATVNRQVANDRPAT